MSRFLSLLVGAALCAGCAQLNPSNEPFASDISELKMVMSNDFTAVYARPGADLEDYASVRILPVQFWGNMEAFDTISDEDKARLKQTLTEALEGALSEQLALAEEAGPGVLDLQVRVTNLNSGSPGSNVISTAAIKFSIDVGQAAMQSEFRDSQTDTLLVAIQDEASGRRFLNHRNFLSKWGDVEKIFEGWSASLAEHVAEAKTMMAKETKATRRQ